MVHDLDLILPCLCGQLWGAEPFCESQPRSLTFWGFVGWWPGWGSWALSLSPRLAGLLPMAQLQERVGTGTQLFLTCLLVKASRRTRSDSRDGEVDSTSWWEELQNTLQKA